jgi:D-arabinose 5-phosphate isomerase GutQ
MAISALPPRATSAAHFAKRATAELEPVIEHFQAVGIPIIAITGNPRSMLGEAAAAPLILPHWPEVGPEAVAPTTSTTMAWRWAMRWR